MGTDDTGATAQNPGGQPGDDNNIVQVAGSAAAETDTLSSELGTASLLNDQPYGRLRVLAKVEDMVVVSAPTYEFAVEEYQRLREVGILDENDRIEL